jgi:putative ABC transport system permease protein
MAVVNQTLASKYFGQEDPIGRRVRIKLLGTLPDGQRVENPDFEIIGVVSDAKNQGIQEPVQAELWVPYTITGAFERGILVRTSSEPTALLQAVRREIWGVDRNVALTLTGSLSEFLRRFTYAGPRFSLILFGVFASAGLVLVLTGVYSTIAYTVSRQTQEIGVRMALGARKSHVLGMVLRMGIALIGGGLGIGLLVSLGVTRVLRSQLWNVSPYDPVTLGLVVVLVTLAGLAACWIPARRAVQVDPMAALRYQ